MASCTGPVPPRLCRISCIRGLSNRSPGWRDRPDHGPHHGGGDGPGNQGRGAQLRLAPRRPQASGCPRLVPDGRRPVRLPRSRRARSAAAADTSTTEAAGYSRSTHQRGSDHARSWVYHPNGDSQRPRTRPRPRPPAARRARRSRRHRGRRRYARWVPAGTPLPPARSRPGRRHPPGRTEQHRSLHGEPPGDVRERPRARRARGTTSHRLEHRGGERRRRATDSRRRRAARPDRLLLGAGVPTDQDESSADEHGVHHRRLVIASSPRLVTSRIGP